MSPSGILLWKLKLLVLLHLLLLCVRRIIRIKAVVAVLLHFTFTCASRTRSLNVSVNVGATLDSNSSGSNKTQQNTVKTILIVKSKESAVIGGILQKSTSTDFDKDFPGVNDTIEPSTNAVGEPVSAQSLFSFVKSKNYTEGKSQFVVFVTPEIIERASDGVQDIRRKFRRRRL